MGVYMICAVYITNGLPFSLSISNGLPLSLSLSSREIVTCAWHPKGQLFASADRNKKVILWKR